MIDPPLLRWLRAPIAALAIMPLAAVPGASNAAPAKVAIRITMGPRTTTSTSARLAWTTTSAVRKTSCRLDRSPPVRCASPASFKRVVPGRHTLRIFVVGRSGSATATRSWKVLPTGATGTTAQQTIEQPQPSGAPAPTVAVSNNEPLANPGDQAAQLSSSTQIPNGDVPGWRQVFSDDFNTPVPIGSFPSAVSSKWWDYPDGWKDTSKRGTYAPSRVVSIHDGLMDLYLHSENGVHLVAAPVPKIPGASSANGMRYGMYAVRFRSDPIPGYKTAWLLWPDAEGWPQNGEIDFPEGNLTEPMCAYTHHLGATEGSDQDAFCSKQTYAEWHTAVMAWLPGQVTYSLDGRVLGVSSARIPNLPMHWVLQTETALDGVVPANASGHLQIDWVSVYRPT